MRHPRAFTLIELIVSLTIFTLFVGVIASTFIVMSRSLQQANEVRKVYTEARGLMDRLTQDIRLYTLDYDCYEDSQNATLDLLECENRQIDGGNGETLFLALISPDGMERVMYDFDDVDQEVQILKWDFDGTDWVRADGFYSGWQTLDTELVEVRQLIFHVAPLVSSYENGRHAGAQFQPSVQIYLEAGSSVSRFGELHSVELQSAVSSRVYSVSF